MGIGIHRATRCELDETNRDLRAKLKVHLNRLGKSKPGVASGLDIETVDRAHGIIELKVKWNKQEFRLLFYRKGPDIFVVNYFQKKTRKTPQNEIELAIARKREIEFGYAPALGSLQ